MKTKDIYVYVSISLAILVFILLIIDFIELITVKQMIKPSSELSSILLVSIIRLISMLL